MDRHYIRDHQVIERYLKGELSPAEEQDFEETYLADQALLDEIELVERLGGGLKQLKTRGEIAPSRTAGWFRVFASPQFAAAASVLLVVSLVFSAALYRDNLSLRQAQSLVAGGGVTRLLPLVSVRGSPEIEIEAPDANELAVLLVDPGFTKHDTYRAVVSRSGAQGSTAIWSAAGLVAEYEDQVAIGMPGRLLTPGDYTIAIEGRMKDWPAARASEPVEQLTVKIVPRAARP
jgi:hypothetical protein